MNSMADLVRLVVEDVDAEILERVERIAFLEAQHTTRAGAIRWALNEFVKQRQEQDEHRPPATGKPGRSE
jgi:hypothetical protein